MDMSSIPLNQFSHKSRDICVLTLAPGVHVKGVKQGLTEQQDYGSGLSAQAEQHILQGTEWDGSSARTTSDS